MMVLERDAYAHHHLLENAWNLHLDRSVCGAIEAGLNYEWLVTNGLGGYAAGSLSGATTRCYHGLLVAALHPPVARTVLVTKIDEEALLPDGQVLKLGVNVYQDGTIDPQGHNYLDAFALDGDIPCFFYRLNATLTLEKRIWMEYGQNTTYVQYALHGAFDEEAERVATSLELVLSPYCLARDYHSVTQGAPDWHFRVEPQGNCCQVQAFDGAPVCQLIADPSALFVGTGLWYWHVWHQHDHESGLPAVEDVYQPGLFRLHLKPGMRKTLVLSCETTLAAGLGRPQHEDLVAQAAMRHQRRIRHILSVADRYTDDLQLRDPVRARLVVAADQFIVARPDYTHASSVAQPLQLAPDRKTIIAGYPWFTDWGRDSMISLPGLLLVTGRYSEARGLLRAFAAWAHNGLIPNRFPDSAGAPVYNTVDATLWLFHALECYLNTTGDWSLLKELFPILSEIIQWHLHGTDFGIQVDPQDGLLTAGVPEVALTWMDAKVAGQVVTPRRGKPVEVNALWYCALTAMESWAAYMAVDATLYGQNRRQVRQNFAARFWYAEGGYLYDVIDVDGVPGQYDASLRPNQLFAGSLTRDLLSDEQMRSMLQQTTTHLLTPAGLRSLSPSDPAYHKLFTGDRLQRDSTYHQGAVWQWLMGPYIDLHLRVYNDREQVFALLLPLVQQIWSMCLGTVGEVAEPEAPFSQGGCFAQAWSVAELLRCWLLIMS